MLLRKPDLERIEAGEIDLVFRRWKRPTVKTGGSLRTAIGMIEIVSVETVDVGAITGEEARRAGLELADLLTLLGEREDGDVYRVELGSLSPDPRVALREDDQLANEDVESIRSRLDRMDRASSRGPWTRQLLELLADSPHVRAQDLADGLGLDRAVLKNDVRKLKRLGLTISHSPGYELSPRGRAFLEKESDR